MEALLKWLKGLSLSKLLTVLEKSVLMWRRTKDGRQARTDQDRLVDYATTTVQLAHAPPHKSLRHETGNSSTAAKSGGFLNPLFSGPGSRPQITDDVWSKPNSEVISDMEGFLGERFIDDPDLDDWSDVQASLRCAREHILEIVAFTRTCSADFVRIGGQELLTSFLDVLSGRLTAIDRWLDSPVPSTDQDRRALSMALSHYKSLREDTIQLNRALAKLLEPHLQRRYRPESPVRRVRRAAPDAGQARGANA